MNKTIRFLIIVTLVVINLPVLTVKAQDEIVDQHCVSNGGIFGVDSNGAQYCIFVPFDWNGDLVLFAHGYVDPRAPVGIPWNQLTLSDQQSSIPGIITGMKYAFAVTSYRQNGLAVKEGIQDLLQLVHEFTAITGVTPSHIYLAGVSEGGLITTLAVEKYPKVFSGGLATCGPIGNFRNQVNYWGDFRVLFDYFFPGVLPPSQVDVPQAVIDNWSSPDGTPGPLFWSVAKVLTENPGAVKELLKTSKAPIDPADVEASTLDTINGLLWYNINATNDGRFELNGRQPYTGNQAQPFSNKGRIYWGSSDDRKLNASVQRFVADQKTLGEITRYYQTSGKLNVPLVVLHTTGDPIVPYWHTNLYMAKVIKNHALKNYAILPVVRYGHCTFTASEMLFGFGWMVNKATHQEFTPRAVQITLGSESGYQEYRALQQEYLHK